MYHIDIITLFPDTVGDVLSESILGRAQERDFLRIQTHQLRDYTLNRQKQVDDYPYGGGRGAVLQADPLFRCWNHLRSQAEGKPRTIYLSPCGKTFTQADAKRLAWEERHLILVCGHYEGVDQRFLDECVDEEISLGDFVLTGDHAKVERWQRKQSLLRTRQRRPDLYQQLDLSSKEDQKLLAELERELNRPSLPQPVEYRQAQGGDLDAMDAILAQAKAVLIPIGQWHENYPAQEDFLEDMARGECYVLTCGGEVGGFFTLSAQPEAGYAAITDGKWGSDEPYAVIHRCAVADRWRGSGLAGHMAAAWEELARAQGLEWLRVDTHRKNKAMVGLLRKSGFQYRGNVLVDAPPPHDPRRVAYEKRLKPRCTQ